MDYPGPTSTGRASFVVGSETFYTSWKVYGSLQSGKQVPLVLLHGGAGIPHTYLLPFIALQKQKRVPIILYDQLGCGESTHLPNKTNDFWNVDLFADELENLVKALGINDQFDLLGHSWGGMLGLWYAATRQSKLRRLVLADTLPDEEECSRFRIERIAQLSQDTQDKINACHSNEIMHTPDFLDALQRYRIDKTVDKKFEKEIEIYKAYSSGVAEYQSKHSCRLKEWPEELKKSMEGYLKDLTVPRAMWGLYALECTGNMITFHAKPYFQYVKARTLIYYGQYDQCPGKLWDDFIEPFPDAQRVEFKESSHMPHFEEPEALFELLGDFLTLDPSQFEDNVRKQHYKYSPVPFS